MVEEEPVAFEKVVWVSSRLTDIDREAADE